MDLQSIQEQAKKMGAGETTPHDELFDEAVGVA